MLVVLQDKLREYEKQIQDLTAKLNAAEKEKSTYELKCGEMEKVEFLARRCKMRWSQSSVGDCVFPCSW